MAKQHHDLAIISIAILFLFVPLSALSNSADWYYKQGKIFYKQKAFKEALNHYEKGIEKHPQSARLYYEKAYVLKKLKQYQKSCEAYESAISLAPNNKRMRRGAGWSYYVAAWKLYRVKDHDNALYWIDKSSQLVTSYKILLRYSQIARGADKIDFSLKALTQTNGLTVAEKDRQDFEDWYIWEAQKVFQWLVDHNIKESGEALSLKLLKESNIPSIQDLALFSLMNLGRLDIANQAISSMKDGHRKSEFKGFLLIFENKFESAEKVFLDTIDHFKYDYLQIGNISEKLYDISSFRGLRDVTETPINFMAMRFQRQAIKQYLVSNPIEKSLAFDSPLLGEFVLSANRLLKTEPYHCHWKKHYRYDFNYYKVKERIGQPVYAIADGEVILIRMQYPDNKPGVKLVRLPSNIIELRHTNGYISHFGHLKQYSSKLKLGDSVKRGQKIAEIGNSGYTGGPHLHFQVENSDGISIPFRVRRVTRRLKTKIFGSFEPTEFLNRSDYIYRAAR